MIWLLAVAVLAALVGARFRNVTSMALLANFAVSTTLCALEVEFNGPLWIALDLIAASFIWRPKCWQDWTILGLYLPIWALYATLPDWASKGVDGIVALQMFLTFPARKVLPVLRGIASTVRHRDPWKDLDLRVYA